MKFNDENMNRLISIFIFAFLSALCFVTANAEPLPRWVKKGVTELDKKRTNRSYGFHIFHEEDQNKTIFELNRFKPLLDYVGKTYGVSQPEVTVDSIPANGSLPATYILNFSKDGSMQTVYARLVDSYSRMSDYADNTSDYNFWQLYAISEPGAIPDFDQFILKRKYGVKPVLMSIIPGLGQIYKGEPAKGYSFLGVEAAMVASIIFATTRANKWNSLANRHPEFYDNYQSKADTFRQWRAFCFVAGGALYIYNLLDAALAKGARYVEVKRPDAPDMRLTFSPVVTPEYLGVGININL